MNTGLFKIRIIVRLYQMRTPLRNKDHWIDTKDTVRADNIICLKPLDIRLFEMLDFRSLIFLPF